MLVYKRMLKYLRPYAGKLVLAGICMIGVVAGPDRVPAIPREAGRLTTSSSKKIRPCSCGIPALVCHCLYAEGSL